MADQAITITEAQPIEVTVDDAVPIDIVFSQSQDITVEFTNPIATTIIVPGPDMGLIWAIVFG